MRQTRVDLRKTKMFAEAQKPSKKDGRLGRRESLPVVVTPEQVEATKARVVEHMKTTQRRQGYSLREFFTVDEMVTFVENVKQRALTSDKLALFILEHTFGKAPQPVVGDDGGPIKIDISHILNKVYGQVPENNDHVIDVQEHDSEQSST